MHFDLRSSVVISHAVVWKLDSDLIGPTGQWGKRNVWFGLIRFDLT